MTMPAISHCPYCKGKKDVVRKGFRKKKHEKIQLYYCKKCEKKFTPAVTKGKQYPLRVIFDALSLYNRLYSFEDAAKLIKEKYGLKISPQNISNWVSDYKEYLTFLRMRGFVEGKYNKREIIDEAKLFHGQIYNFSYHRAKMELILNEEFRHYKLSPLREFLDLVVAECPHGVFRETSLRASEFKDTFSLDQVRIRPKQNYAVKIARIILQAVNNNRLRHQALQEFMLSNDSVTVAVEVPVLLDGEDIRHYQNHLGFDLGRLVEDFKKPSFKENPKSSALNSSEETPSSLEPRTSNLSAEQTIITGHIDIVQVRNGSIHILDYKPGAGRVKPVDQLTIYALALSRLTGIRLYHFKCAWFDREEYFEFFPLHVVHKKKKVRKRKKRGKKRKKTK